MKVFVTGGNGFIGSVVVRTLLAEGHQVVCLLRGSSKTDRIDGLGWERAEGDVRDADSVRRGMKGCDGVVHLASISNWSDMDSPLMTEVVEGGTTHVLDAARAQPGTRVVFVSSVLAVNGSTEPRTFDESARWTLDDDELAYSRSKRRAEDLCQKAVADGVPVVIVNPAEVYGPNDTTLVTAGNLIDFAKSNPVLVCKGGTSVVHVDDVALAIVRALEKGKSGERYILGGENLTLKELAGLCLEVLGKQKRIVTVPNPVIKGITRVASTFKIPLPYNKHVIPYATKYWFMDNTKATRELGVSFRSARATLEPTLQWLRDSGRIS